MNDEIDHYALQRRQDADEDRITQLEADNAELKRGLRHAHYRVHWHTPDSCSGCEEIEALLKEPE